MNPNKKWLNLGLLGISVAAWFLYYQIFTGIWSLLRISHIEIFNLSLPEILSTVLAGITFIVLKIQRKISSFGLEVVSELNKVTWPTQKETALSTGVIIIMVGIVCLLLALIDFIWVKITISLMGS